LDGDLAPIRSNQFKRERPSFRTAHDFFKEEGGFSIDPERHSLQGKQRDEEIKKTINELLQVTRKQFPCTQNLEYAILKSHLIVEYALIEYIRGHAITAVDSKNIRFTFSQKLEIAYLLGFGVNDPVLLPTVERLIRFPEKHDHL